MAFDPNDPDTKKALAEAVKTAVDEAKTGLETKNSELLDELKKTKAELRQHKDIDPADLQKLETEIEKVRADLAETAKAKAAAEKAAEKAAKDLEAESGFTHKLVAENGVLKALADVGVSDPAYLEAAKALHMGRIKVVTEGEERKAVYDDKPLDEAIKAWAAGDVGKKFVTAPNNSGGGAGGGGKDGEAKTMTRAEYNEKITSDPAATQAFIKEGGKVVDEVA